MPEAQSRFCTWKEYSRLVELVEPIAVSGLDRIGNNEAVRALSSGMQIKDNNAGVLARAALQRLEAELKLAGISCRSGGI